MAQTDDADLIVTNARISTLMRNLAASAYFENPVLAQTQAAQVGSRRLNDFSMSVSIRQVKVDDGKAAAPANATAQGKKP